MLVPAARVRSYSEATTEPVGFRSGLSLVIEEGEAYTFEVIFISASCMIDPKIGRVKNTGNKKLKCLVFFFYSETWLLLSSIIKGNQNSCYLLVPAPNNLGGTVRLLIQSRITYFRGSKAA